MQCDNTAYMEYRFVFKAEFLNLTDFPENISYAVNFIVLYTATSVFNL